MIFSWFNRSKTARVAAQWWADLAKENIEASIWGKPAEKKHALDCMLAFRVVLQMRIRQELAKTPNFTLQVDDGQPDELLCETLDYAGLPRAALSVPHALMMIDQSVVRVQRGTDQIIITLTA